MTSSLLQWMVESTNDAQCYNELQLLAQSDVELHARLQATDALFVALNEARDQIVEITDAEYNVLVRICALCHAMQVKTKAEMSVSRATACHN